FGRTGVDLMLTRRQRITKLLDEIDQPLTAIDIREILELESISKISEDLTHIAKSVQNEGKQLLMRPASCGDCGFVFRSRTRPDTPSRCPECKSERIRMPAYTIVDKED
ncbi:MAG: transcriptional regulator, partial [Promethearchaeia archaeon]